MNEIETKEHLIAKLGGEILLDPINLTPAGIASKGSKVAGIDKSAAMGLPVGTATMVAKNYGDTDKSLQDKINKVGVSASVVGALNGVIATLTKGKIQNAFKDIDEFSKAISDGKDEAVAAIKALKENPEVFGLSEAKANEVVRLIDMHWSKEAKKEASRML